MNPRRTDARVAIAAALLRGRSQTHWGYELSREAGVGAGSMYPFLRELLAEGHLKDGWEALEEAQGRPPRRYYTVTAEGADFLARFLSGAPAPSRRRVLVPTLNPKAVRT